MLIASETALATHLILLRISLVSKIETTDVFPNCQLGSQLLVGMLVGKDGLGIDVLVP